MAELREVKRGSLEWLLIDAHRAGEEGLSYDEWRSLFLPDAEELEGVEVVPRKRVAGDREPRCSKPYRDKDGDIDYCSFPQGHVGSCW